MRYLLASCRKQPRQFGAGVGCAHEGWKKQLNRRDAENAEEKQHLETSQVETLLGE